LEGSALGIHAIGRALVAFHSGLNSRHAVKQVDRLLSNTGVDVWNLFARWVPFVVVDPQEIVAALDWTDFDAADQSTLALSMIVSHGRAAALENRHEAQMNGWHNEWISLRALPRPTLSKVGGIPEIVEHESNGLLVPARDVKALEAALARILSSPGLLLELSSRARPSVQARFSIDRMTRETEDVLVHALGARPRGDPGALPTS
jgi:hypothetical protein